MREPLFGVVGALLLIEDDREENNDFNGAVGVVCPSILHILTWRVPTVTKLFPTQIMDVIFVVHLLLEYKEAAPFRLLIFQM